MRYLLLLVALLYFNSLSAQKENFYWAFGTNAGMSWKLDDNETSLPAVTARNVFNLSSISGTTESILNFPRSIRTAITSGEGCFSVANYKGEGLFYSNGERLWDAKGKPIIEANTILTGNNSSAQSGIVIPYPSKPNHYITLTLGTDISSNGTNDLGYAVVKVEDNGTVSAVSTQKRIIKPPTGFVFKESITAVRHANKKHFWLVIPSRPDYTESYGTVSNSERFKYYLNIYKVDENGINLTPVVESLETTTYTNSRTAGQIRFSKDGKRFGFIAYRRSATIPYPTKQYNNFVVGNFDDSNGTISNLKFLESGTGSQNTYGIEFDASGQYIYITTIQTTDLNLYKDKRYLMYVYDANKILNDDANAKVPIYQLEKDYIASDDVENKIPIITSRPYFGSILRGPDDRLYIVEYRNRNIFVITNPSDPLNLKLYRVDNFLQPNTIGQLGLPTYASFFFNVDLEMPVLCVDKETTLKIHISAGEGSDEFSKVIVDLGDGSPLHTIENPKLSSVFTINHQYPKSGTFIIKMTSFDLNNTVIEASSKEIIATVSNCYLKVNPHIRVNL